MTQNIHLKFTKFYKFWIQVKKEKIKFHSNTQDIVNLINDNCKNILFKAEKAWVHIFRDTWSEMMDLMSLGTNLYKSMVWVHWIVEMLLIFGSLFLE